MLVKAIFSSIRLLEQNVEPICYISVYLTSQDMFSYIQYIFFSVNITHEIFP